MAKRVLECVECGNTIQYCDEVVWDWSLYLPFGLEIKLWKWGKVPYCPHCEVEDKPNPEAEAAYEAGVERGYNLACREVE